MKKIRSEILRTISILIVAAIFINLFVAGAFYVHGLYSPSNPKVKIHDVELSIMYSFSIWFSSNYGDYLPTEEIRYMVIVQGFARELYMAIILGLFIAYYLQNLEKKNKKKRKPIKKIKNGYIY